MIIILNDTGQFCNRVLLFAHCLATGIELDTKVVHCLFEKDEDFFEKNNTNTEIKVLKNKKALTVCQILNKIFCYINRKKKLFINFDRTYRIFNRLIIILTWNYRDNKALFKHRNVIKEYFLFKKEYYVAPQNLLTTLHEKYDAVVGVHMRKGDYKYWESGRFYFSDSDYLKFMMSFKKSFVGSVAFVLCSNEFIDFEFYKNSGLKIFLSTNHRIEDIITMSGCDYLMGPPSTYSWWAAFIGENKYLTLKSANLDVDYRAFRQVESDEYNPNYYIIY